MPRHESLYRFQYAVLWEADGTFDSNGEPGLEDPAEIRVRWVPKRSQSPDPRNEETSVDVTAVVNQEIPVGSRMWLGRLVDWADDGDSELYEVMNYNATLDIKGRVTRRTVSLMRLRRTLAP